MITHVDPAFTSIESAPSSMGQRDLPAAMVAAMVHLPPDEAHAETEMNWPRRRLPLTPRQTEVLHWVAEGKTNSEISTILQCSLFTVKNHVKEIFQRLGVNTRAGASAFAYRAYVAREHASSPTLARAVKADRLLSVAANRKSRSTGSKLHSSDPSDSQATV